MRFRGRVFHGETFFRAPVALFFGGRRFRGPGRQVEAGRAIRSGRRISHRATEIAKALRERSSGSPKSETRRHRFYRLPAGF